MVKRAKRLFNRFWPFFFQRTFLSMQWNSSFVQIICFQFTKYNLNGCPFGWVYHSHILVVQWNECSLHNFDSQTKQMFIRTSSTGNNSMNDFFFYRNSTFQMDALLKNPFNGSKDVEIHHFRCGTPFYNLNTWPVIKVVLSIVFNDHGSNENLSRMENLSSIEFIGSVVWFREKLEISFSFAQLNHTSLAAAHSSINVHLKLNLGD